MEVKTVFGYTMFVHNFDDYISNVIRAHGCWEPNLTKLIVYLYGKYTGDTKVIFDVGANIGYYSVLCSMLDGRSDVHAFEPSKLNYPIFEKTIEKHGLRNIRLNKYCIGDRDNVELCLSMDEHNIAAGKHHNMGGISVVNQSDAKTHSLTLDTYIAENHIGEVFLMKVDVEGYEYNVLRGATKALRDRVFRYIVLEVTPKFCDVGLCRVMFDMITMHGYACYDLGLQEGGKFAIDEGYRIANLKQLTADNVNPFLKSIVQSNLLFVRQAKN